MSEATPNPRPGGRQKGKPVYDERQRAALASVGLPASGGRRGMPGLEPVKKALTEKGLPAFIYPQKETLNEVITSKGELGELNVSAIPVSNQSIRSALRELGYFNEDGEHVVVATAKGFLVTKVSG